MALGNIENIRGEDGLVRYVSPAFENYDEAKAFRANAQSAGFTNAFVVGFFEGKLIPAHQALEMKR